MNAAGGVEGRAQNVSGGDPGPQGQMIIPGQGLMAPGLRGGTAHIPHRGNSVRQKEQGIGGIKENVDMGIRQSRYEPLTFTIDHGPPFWDGGGRSDIFNGFSPHNDRTFPPLRLIFCHGDDSGIGKDLHPLGHFAAGDVYHRGITPGSTAGEKNGSRQNGGQVVYY